LFKILHWRGVKQAGDKYSRGVEQAYLSQPAAQVCQALLNTLNTEYILTASASEKKLREQIFKFFC